MMDTKKSISSVCRICMVYNSDEFNGVYLFDKTVQLNQKVMMIADVKIEEGDDLPNSICWPCIKELENAISFKRKCEESDSLFRSDWKPKIEIIATDNSVKSEGDCKSEGDVSDDELPLQVFRSDKGSEKIKEKSRGNHKNFTCETCEELFVSKFNLNIHKQNVHGETPQIAKYICDCCRRPFKMRSTFEKHIHGVNSICSRIRGQTHLIKIKYSSKVPSTRIYSCLKCSYETKVLIRIADHLVTHTKKRPWKCNICSKTFLQSGQLRCHQQSKHEMNNHQETCEYCGKIFRYREALRTHIRIHKATTVQCDICKKVYKGKLSLKTHILRHDKSNKSFKCEICGLRFFSENELKQHKRRHNDELKRHLCGVCGYRAHRKSVIQSHILKHTLSLSHFCAKCGRGFATDEKLQSHIKIHTSEPEFSCPYCPSVFFLAKSAKRHLRKKHGNLKKEDTSAK